MSSKYYDSSSVIQVIGNVLNNPSLLDDTGEYNFREEDFDNDFHKVIFGAVYNLHFMGAEKLNTRVIEDFLRSKEKSWAIYKANKGAEWLHKAFIEADVMNFRYYYDRMKKMTLLRTYDDIGLDVSWIYDPDNIVDLDLKQEQSQRLDDMALKDVADAIDNRVLRVREMVVDNDIDESCQIGQGIDKMMKDLQEKPIVGNPLYDPYTNEIVMGARMGTFYIRSAATGVGNIRSFFCN